MHSIPEISTAELEARTSAGIRESLIRQYESVRRLTQHLCEPLEVEDFVVQSMEDVSPTKWHIAHTSWFFEQFVLRQAMAGYESLNPQYAYLFNSYYVQAGERHCRPRRGLATRPTVREAFDYRRHVDEAMLTFLESADDGQLHQWADTIIIGLNHEQQHQELMLTDIKHVFWSNPLRPAYRPQLELATTRAPYQEWKEFGEGIRRVGHDGRGFAYDNEGPSHRVFLEPFCLASRLVTNGEFIEFMHDGGYGRPELWLSEGWTTVQDEGWDTPLYWENREGEWWVMTLGGMHPVSVHEPVCHISYFEADAYARWAGCRLPTEFEWEVASEGIPLDGNFVDAGRLHPESSRKSGERLDQMFGDVWEWTQSHYSPYPGYKPAPGAIGEYNGKFMCNQFVLRGGSCATSRSHIRRTYRNFFPSNARWQFSGLRLAKEA